MSAAMQISVLEDVKSVVESTLRMPAGKLDINADFEDFGIDSIIAMELLDNLSRKFEISITPAEFTDISTVKELAEHIDELYEQPVKPPVTEVEAVRDSSELSARREDPAPLTGNNSQSRRVSAPPVGSIRRGTRKRAGQSGVEEVLDYVRHKYSVDLAGRGLNSVDQIVDELVCNHAEQLIAYYNGFSVDETVVKDAVPDKRSVESHAGVEPANTKDIAIVGISCHFPDGPDCRSFWRNLTENKCSIREIPASRWNWQDYYDKSPAKGKTISKWGALISDIEYFDAGLFGVRPEHAGIMDPQERLLLQEVYRAFQDACMDISKLSGSNTGVFVGYEYSEYEMHLRERVKEIGGRPLYSTSSPTYYLANRLSFILDFCGPSEAINVNCASSAAAINRAYGSLVTNESDLAVAGGVSLNMFVDDYIYASQHGMLSADGTCGVFDDDANGFTRGEGVAAIVLKRLGEAERDNNRIYGVIKSSHQNNRGYAKTLSDIKPVAFTEVMQKCYRKADVDPSSVKYIEVDGYSTKWADSVEFEGIKSVFEGGEPNSKSCALGSLKGNIGHLEPASGIASVIKIALSFANKTFPATVSKKKLNQFIDIDDDGHPLYIADRSIPFSEIRESKNSPIRAGVNSFADSGVNIHILLEEYVSASRRKTKKYAEETQLFVLSAKDTDRLEAYVKECIGFLREASERETLENIAYTTQLGRPAMDERLAVVASSREELADKLALICERGLQAELAVEAEGIYIGSVSAGNGSNLLGLITSDLGGQQIESCLASRQWSVIAPLWVNGIDVPWAKGWQNESADYIAFPTYPFARERYWLGADQSTPKAGDANQTAQRGKAGRKKKPGRKSGRARVAPRNAKEKDLMGLWAEVLQQDPDTLSVHDEFFDRGGDSNTAMNLVAAMQEHFGLSLSLDVLFRASTIAQMADIVSSSKGVDSDVLVTIHDKGRRKPIYAVPGATGNVMSLRPLSIALGEDQPFYGLEALGLNNDTPPLESVEQIADTNIAAIKQHQKRGPYTLLGYSNGGIVAFEMAARLLAEGDDVRSLLLLDTLCPTVSVRDVVEEVVEACNSIIAESGRSLDLTASRLREIPESERCDYLYQEMVAQGFDMPKDHFVNGYNVALASQNACRKYTPGILPKNTDVRLFKALNGDPDAPEDYGWNQLLPEPAQVFNIDANHLSIIESNPAREIARIIEKIK